MTPDPLLGKRVLITGASGFLGSRLARRLHSAGAEIFGVSRIRRTSPDFINWSVDGLMAPAGVRDLFKANRPEIVFHVAGMATGATALDLVTPALESLLVSTINVLTAAAECDSPRVVLVASLEEPQEAEGVPASPYAAAKSAAGAYGRMFHALYDLPVVSVRPYMTYGPGQPAGKILPHVITSLLKGNVPQLASGRRQVDWIYIDDVIEGMALAATQPGIDGQTLDLGSGKLVTIREAVETIVRIMKPAVEPAFGAVPDRPFEITRVADIAQTKDLLGWQPVTSLETGLTRTIEWHRANS
jgi:UDP-glucose 4-epimerase